MEHLKVENKVFQQIKAFETKGFRFKPGRKFFIEIGIRQKRWGQLMRNEKSITIEELEKVSNYFDIPIGKLTEHKNKLI